MAGRPLDTIPADTGRGTRSRQLSVSLSDEEAAQVERIRIRQHARSWGEAVRWLIARDAEMEAK